MCGFTHRVKTGMPPIPQTRRNIAKQRPENRSEYRPGERYSSPRHPFLREHLIWFGAVNHRVKHLPKRADSSSCTDMFPVGTYENLSVNNVSTSIDETRRRNRS